MEILTKSVSIPQARERKVRARLTKSLKTPKWYARARLTARFISQIRRRALCAGTRYMIWSMAVCFAENIMNARTSIIRVSIGNETRKRIFVRFKRIYLQNCINVLFLYLVRLKRKFALKSFFAICLHMCKKSSTFAANLKTKTIWR